MSIIILIILTAGFYLGLSGFWNGVSEVWFYRAHLSKHKYSSSASRILKPCNRNNLMQQNIKRGRSIQEKCWNSDANVLPV